MRRTTRQARVGGVPIGGSAPISVQSMTNIDTRDAAATIAQIHRLQAAGCELVRAAVFDFDAAKAFRTIRDAISIPLVADVHFDYRLAVAAIENGADKLRINPGNIGSEARVRTVADCARAHGVPIRIGVNAGSLEKDLKERFGPASPEAMVESALRHVRILESCGFTDIVLSLKASAVADCVEAYRRMARLTDYPLHIGITETGGAEMGVVKSSIGLGALLLDGIGDTLRVSLTDDPVREVELGLRILRALGLRRDDVEIVSCPTCGRTRVDLMTAVKEVSRRVPRNAGYLKIAVMGCAVNGPGEAVDADIGIAFGDGNGVIFRKGEKYKSGPMPEILDALIADATEMLGCALQ